MVEEAKTIEENQSLSDRQIALQHALEIGLPPDQLSQLGHEITNTPEPDDNRFTKWSLVAAGALLAIDAGVNALAKSPPSEIARSAANLLFTPGNAPVTEATWRATLDAAKQWTMYWIQAAIVIGAWVTSVKAQLTKSDKVREVRELFNQLTEAKNKGEAPILMPDGYTAIDLGQGDAIGRAVGQQVGWGNHSLPLLESSINTSGTEVWRKLPNPETGITKNDFFESLDTIGFDRAKSFILCPVKEQQSFLPDPTNPDHFDLDFNGLVDRINLIDEYCEQRGIPPKRIIIIGDKNIQRSIGTATVENGKITYANTKTITLENKIDEINESRKNTAGQKGYEAQEVIIADPTDITLDLLNSEKYNPEHLPLRFHEDPNESITYAARFIERCNDKKGISVITDPNYTGKALEVGYGIDDVATNQTTALLPENNTIAIIIDEARAVKDPYKSLVLAQEIRDWVVNQL